MDENTLKLVARLLLGIFLFVDTSEAGGYCNDEYCPGIRDYCCLDDDNNTVCCSDDVSDFWWLWFILAMVLVFILSCISCCIRMRRNRTRRYLIITGERPVTTCTTTTYPAYGACNGYGTTEGCAPVLVSPVVYGQQLPPYSPVAENKGRPPPYNPAQN